jgi:DnaJ family protein C protein 28
MTEKMLREAIEAGEFDNLPGKGQPLDLRENPFEDPDLRTVHRLLRNAGFAPAWIEERKDIDSSFLIGRQKLARAWQLFGKPSNEEHPDWIRNEKEFRELTAALNERIKMYNLKAPAVGFHRKRIDTEATIQAVKNEGKGES